VGFALERPLWRFAHPQFASPAKPAGFAYSGCQTVANLVRYTTFGKNSKK
jgi:hypothetical protein